MKLFTLFLVLYSFQAYATCNPSALDGSEKNEELEKTNYGEIFEVTSPLELADVLNGFEDFDGQEIQLKAHVKSVCQTKGCWLGLGLKDDQEIRVRFKDYGFFVPKNAAGAEAIFTGIATRKVTDAATLKHYAEDEGLTAEEIDAITEDKEELTFVATGVKMRGVPAQADEDEAFGNYQNHHVYLA